MTMDALQIYATLCQGMCVNYYYKVKLSNANLQEKFLIILLLLGLPKSLAYNIRNQF